MQEVRTVVKQKGIDRKAIVRSTARVIRNLVRRTEPEDPKRYERIRSYRYTKEDLELINQGLRALALAIQRKHAEVEMPVTLIDEVDARRVRQKAEQVRIMAESSKWQDVKDMLVKDGFSDDDIGVMKDIFFRAQERLVDLKSKMYQVVALAKVGRSWDSIRAKLVESRKFTRADIATLKAAYEATSPYLIRRLADVEADAARFLKGMSNTDRAALEESKKRVRRKRKEKMERRRRG